MRWNRFFRIIQVGVVTVSVIFLCLLSREELAFQDVRSRSVKLVRYLLWIPTSEKLLYKGEGYVAEDAAWVNGVRVAFETAPLEVSQVCLVRHDGNLYEFILQSCSMSTIGYKYRIVGEQMWVLREEQAQLKLPTVDITWSWASKGKVYLYCCNYWDDGTTGSKYSVIYPVSPEQSLANAALRFWELPWDPASSENLGHGFWK
mgnify:CR=1 FL=1